MRPKILAGNWKMNMTSKEAEEFFKSLISISGNHFPENKKVIIFPTYPVIGLGISLVSGSKIEIGAQNLSQFEKGAYTGEVSASILKSAGCSYVIIGHSERRQYFHENEEILSAKVNQALLHGITPVYCCGETLEQREQNEYEKVISAQIEGGLFHLSPEEFSNVIIAYEPVWAIGTGRNASPEQAQEVHHFIRDLVKNKFGEKIADQLIILYGGSVKSSNSGELFSQLDIDGGLIGGASLIAEEFYKIIQTA